MADAEFDIEAPDFRTLIARVKEFDPKMATVLRRELRQSGDGIIAAQRELLAADGPVTEQISAGLRTRVTAGKTRQSVSVKSTGPRVAGYNLAAVFEKRVIRHPVFGDTNAWVEQPGRPYFNPPIKREYAAMRGRIADAVENTLRRMQP